MGDAVANLPRRIFERAREKGWSDRVALREPAREWSYERLEDQVRRVHTALRSLRVSRGDRVAVFMPDTLEAAAAILGVIHMGAIAVPLSELCTAMDIRDYVTDCGAVAAVVHASLEPTVDEIRTEVPTLREVIVVGSAKSGERDFLSLVRGAAPAAESADVELKDTAMVLYSAGASEGVRRGVPHAHATPFIAFESYCRGVLGMTEQDRVFSVVRLSTAYGLGTGLLFPLIAGAEATLLPEQPTSDAILSVLDAQAPTVLFATPSVYGQLARDAEAAKLRKPLAKVRACVSGAEGMPPQLIARARTILGTEVSVGYGLTEAFQFVLASKPGDVRPGSCGRLVPQFDARIMGRKGARLGANEIGTLYIKGPTVSGKYFNRGDAGLVDGGWFPTRDRFMVDDEGYYIHCGREDDLFKVGGKWVSPTEVEQSLLGHEAVWECAVIGADDQDGLVKPLAFVVPNIGHVGSEKLASELREHVKSELAPYKYPRWIEFVDALPKGPTGKVLRYKLQPPPASKRRAETSSG
jgi:benzoate-CoA ligase family protein